jgi:hypothetical protein
MFKANHRASHRALYEVPAASDPERMGKTNARYLAFACCGGMPVLAAAAPIPFPAALDAVAVTQGRLDTDGDGFLDGCEVFTGHLPLALQDKPALVAEAWTAIESTFPTAWRAML